jgi:hypothetical protein
MAVKLLGDVAGLHGQHAHAVVAVQRFGGDRERGNVALVPVDDHQLLGAVLAVEDAGLDDQAACRCRASA